MIKFFDDLSWVEFRGLYNYLVVKIFQLISFLELVS